MYPNQAFESESVRIDACEEGVVLSLVHSGLVARHTGVEDVFGQPFSHILDTTKRIFKRTNLPCAVVGNEGVCVAHPSRVAEAGVIRGFPTTSKTL